MSESKYRAVRTVAVIRPPQPSEQQLSSLLSVARPSQDTADAATEKKSYTIDCGGGVSFQFPAVYGYAAEDLDSLCQREVEPLLQGSFLGESSAVIAYGQTGAGKSYICGTECKSPVPWKNSVGAYVSRRIWEIQKEKRLNKDFSVEISMIEIYREGSSKETTLDLLGSYTRVPLSGYSEGSIHEVFSGEELLEKLLTGSGLRNTDATNGNARSSRSHAIMTIRIQYTRMDASKRAQRVSGKLLIVDLAGAEAASAAVANSAQQKQGSGINVGLSALQLVIREVATAGKTLHYRDSKLTHLLKPALGGEDGTQGCNATFLGCVSPSLSDVKRTQNTLNYMMQASNIKNSVLADVKLLEAKREAALKKENDKLKAQLQIMAAELQAVAAAASAAEGKNEDVMVASMATPAVRAEDVVVLSKAEHQELLARRDAAVALEVILQNDQERFASLQKELEHAKARIQELEEHISMVEAAAAKAGAGVEGTPQQTIPPPLEKQQMQQQQKHVEHLNALSPAMAAISISPILLAASRSTDMFEDGPLTSRSRPGSAGTGNNIAAADGNIITNNANSTGVEKMPVGGISLELDDICLPSDISNLGSEQLEVLQKLVRVRLIQGDTPSSSSSAAASSSSAAGLSLQSALRRRTAEVSALRFAVHSYNACLGDLKNELSLVKESEKETSRMLHQAAQEKVQYVELVAKHQQALDIAQYDVVTLDAEVKELKQQKAALTPLLARGGGGTAERTSLFGSPGSSATSATAGGSGGGLLNRLMGRSPIASPPPSSPLSSRVRKETEKTPVIITTAVEPSGVSTESPSPMEMTAATTTISAETPASGSAHALNTPVSAPFEFYNDGGGGGGGGGGAIDISPFPIADIDLSDNSESEYEESTEGEDRNANIIIDLTGEDDADDDSPARPVRSEERKSVSAEGKNDGQDIVPSIPKIPSVPSPIAPPSTAEDVNKELQSSSSSQQQQQQQRQVSEMQKKMAGGVDVSAIGAARSGALSEEFVEKNQHWRPFQKNKSTKSKK